ncbi:MAG TPA: hypothetical protein DEO84_04690 [candidate division Zixibacteria bacterium]|nr:hypothetical protein [candidate division Zixibacteria bacterium]HBZ00604.1 hypothetical protein [candidate division Zixibacteria bacterium]
MVKATIYLIGTKLETVQKELAVSCYFIGISLSVSISNSGSLIRYNNGRYQTIGPILIKALLSCSISGGVYISGHFSKQ